MGNMAAGHKQPIISNSGHAAATFSAGIDRDMFTNAVALANDRAAFLALELEILWDLTKHRKREHLGVITNLAIPGDHHMGFQCHPRTQNHLGADMAKGPNLAALTNPGTLFDHRTGVNLAHPIQSF